MIVDYHGPQPAARSPQPMLTIGFIYAATFSISLALGCQDDGGGGGSNEDTCNCTGYAWYCYLNGLGIGTNGCASSVGDAQTACTNYAAFNDYQGEVMFGSQMCDELVPAETGDGCTGWSPVSDISFNSSSGAYEIDKDFIDDVINDPAQLVHCEASYITVHSTAPVYGITNVSTGDIADLLGLSNGDRFDTINGTDIDSKADLIEVFGGLYTTGETDFSLVVNRPGIGPVTLTYEIVP